MTDAGADLRTHNDVCVCVYAVYLRGGLCAWRRKVMSRGTWRQCEHLRLSSLTEGKKEGRPATD